MKILADASLPALKTAFTQAFILTQYNTPSELSSLLPTQDILLCRSTLRVDEKLLAHTNLSFIATASSGTDHIDQALIQAKKIQLIDAKGANANAVADYVIAVLAYLASYQQARPRKAAIIGAGHVGTKVAERLKETPLNVILYDPLKASHDKTFVSASLEEVLTCDLICLHPNLHSDFPFPSKHLINHEFLECLQSETTIINASRGDIVDEEALLSYQDKIIYCTDVYSKEPFLNSRILSFATICTPHIAGHSIEAKRAAIIQISQELRKRLHLPDLNDKLSSIPLPFPAFDKKDPWYTSFLALYNPMHETSLLKEASDPKEAFLSLRKMHCSRHDFCRYALSADSPSTFRRLIGYTEKAAFTTA